VLFKKLTSNNITKQWIEVVGNEESKADEVAEAGCKLLVNVYGGKSSDTLNSLRYTKYNSVISKSKAKPKKLPPGSYFHCHIQVIQWKSMSSTCVNPMEWGWQLSAGKFEPIPTDQEPGPQELLKISRCSCKPSTKSHCDTNKYTCHNNGLTCIASCGHCYGTDCLDVAAAV